MLHHTEKSQNAKESYIQTLKNLQQLVAARGLKIQVNKANPEKHMIRVIDANHTVYAQNTMRLDASKRSYAAADIKSARKTVQSIKASIGAPSATGAGDIPQTTDTPDEPEVELNSSSNGNLGAAVERLKQAAAELRFDNAYAEEEEIEVTSGEDGHPVSVPVTVLTLERTLGAEHDTENVDSMSDMHQLEDKVSEICAELGVEYDYNTVGWYQLIVTLTDDDDVLL